MIEEDYESNRSIVRCNEKMYMFEGYEVKELSEQYKVTDDRFASKGEFLNFRQRFANTEGIIFMLDSEGHKVYRLDTFGAKKIELVTNLS